MRDDELDLPLGSDYCERFGLVKIGGRWWGTSEFEPRMEVLLDNDDKWIDLYNLSGGLRVFNPTRRDFHNAASLLRIPIRETDDHGA